ncbi:MAG: hypothetical protein HKN76_03585, partial [Saprospiraceae bacterium]|nr:hypothetical protein [Saprospiraceae bacterium]
MKRRTFLRTGSASLMGFPMLLGPQHFVFNGSLGSPLVSVFDKHASSLHTSPGKVPNNDRVIVDLIDGFTVNRARLANMMDTAVIQLTGKSSVGNAWESLFPEGYPRQDTKISIKINLSYGEPVEENNWNSTHCPFGPKVALSDA